MKFAGRLTVVSFAACQRGLVCGACLESASLLSLLSAMQKYIEQLDEVRYRINVGAVPNMRVPCRFYVNGALRSTHHSHLVRISLAFSVS